MTNEERFKEIYQTQITRTGAPELLEWLESTDFFTAPASTRFHGAYAVTGRVGSGCVGTYTGRKRKNVGIECTAAERLEIQFDYDFFRAALEEEMERFYSAFLIKNGIFPPNGKECEELPEPEETSKEEALKIQALMMGMDTHTRRAALESGVET